MIKIDSLLGCYNSIFRKMLFMDSLIEYFGTNDLYKVIGAKKSDTKHEISKAYRKICLKNHPIKNRHHRELATKKIQVSLLNIKND